MPLQIKISKVPKDVELKVFVSYKNPEPDHDRCDEEYTNCRLIKISEQTDEK